MVNAELVEGCNLKCALCPNRNHPQSMKQISLKTVQQILRLYKYQSIDWFNWGEPLLHKEFITIAGMMKNRDCKISTNFSLRVSDETFDALTKFRTTVVSLSGLTQEVYQIYNCGGRLDLVLHNLETLASGPRRRIIVNWLQHKYNAHQYEMCKDYCQRLGVEFYPFQLNCTVEELIEGFDHELLKVPKFTPRHLTTRKECKILKWIPIDVEGNYLLCCVTQNIKLGYNIYDNITQEELIQAKLKIPTCITCRENNYWHMFS